MTPSEPPSSHRSKVLAAGDRLGRYEVTAFLGRGGMGEVYRARDPDLHRDVALKVLRRHRAEETDIERFGREARAAGSLSHPNIVAVFDVGTEAGVPYVVSELLEGETLRARLDRGPLPFRKAVDYGIQIALALVAAHAKNIWHRDVKPANAFITRHGQVKLLDFGIAKLGRRTLDAAPEDPTGGGSWSTEIVGTAGYMSPEQVEGTPVDHRADLFALGSVLYEMFTGTRAFKGATAVETMTAVLRTDPPDPVTLKADLPPMAAAVVRRCLEKDRDDRFQSARDLVFSLQQLQDATTRATAVRLPPPGPRRMLWPAALAVATVAALWLVTRGAPSSLEFEQVTFASTSGVAISGARFAQNGRVVYYSQAQEGIETSVWQVGLPESGMATSQPLGLDYPLGTDVLAATGNELALLMDRTFVMGERFAGTLATAVVGGGGAKNEAVNVEAADYHPDGRLAVVISTGARGPSTLEYPLGNPLYQTAHSLRFPRVSPDGQRIAFVLDTSGRGAGGNVWVMEVDADEPRQLTIEPYDNVRGLAWSNDGEIWFAASKGNSDRALRAVDLDGRERPIRNLLGAVTLWDIAADGHVLLTRDDEWRSTWGRIPGETAERDFSWNDDTGVAGLSRDGGKILFADRFGVYVRSTDGSLPTPVTPRDLFADALSPAGEHILATRPMNDSQDAGLLLLPIGVGEQQELGSPSIVEYSGALFFPSSPRILFNGREAGAGMRVYAQSIDGGPPEALTGEGEATALAISPDDHLVASGEREDGMWLHPVDGGAPAFVESSEPNDRPVAFSEDGQSLFGFRREVPAPVFRIDLDTGTRIPLMEVPRDLTGVYAVSEFHITPDGQTYFYSFKRRLSRLYVVRGLK